MEHRPKDSLVPFAPVALRERHDGWTAQKQIAFIEALAETACVEEACRRVGMSDSSAYRLRRRPSGGPFREAWDAALDYAVHRLEQAAIGRALNGVPRPVFYRGEQVGEWREYDERLAMFLLRHRRPGALRTMDRAHVRSRTIRPGRRRRQAGSIDHGHRRSGRPKRIRRGR